MGVAIANKLPTLKSGDLVEVIAPASRCSNQQLLDIKNLLENCQLKCLISENIFGKDLLCANTDELRFNSLKNAFCNLDTKAIICARGGYGSMRLIPSLSKLVPPEETKLFIGMSDITALNLFLMQQWHWPVLHAALALDKFNAASITLLKKIMFNEMENLFLAGQPLNDLAKKNQLITTEITGGNLSIIQNSIGTNWQIQTRNKIIFLEEVSERGYRIDRMLEHLCQANIFQDAKAIIFGDFLLGNEPDGSSLVEPVLERFAAHCKIPVIRIKGIGHGPNNSPLPMGVNTKLQLGKAVKLCISNV